MLSGCSGDVEKPIPNSIYHNDPVLTTVYHDPESEIDMVCVIVAVPGGATDVEFSLVGSGPGSSTGLVTYDWPKIAFDMDRLFASSPTS